MTIKMVAQRVHYDPAARRDRKAGEEFTVADESEADKLERRHKAMRAGAATAPAHVDPPKTVAQPAPNADDDVTALRQTYETKVGKRPFMGWSAEELKEKIGQYNRRDMRAQD